MITVSTAFSPKVEGKASKCSIPNFPDILTKKHPGVMSSRHTKLWLQINCKGGPCMIKCYAFGINEIDMLEI